MKRHIHFMMAVFMIVFTLLGCKKDDFTNDSISLTTTEQITKKAKDWFYALPQIQTVKGEELSKNNVINVTVGNPIWNKTVFFENTNTSITPIVYSKTANQFFSKYFVAEFEGAAINTGYVYVVLQDKSKSQKLNVINPSILAGTNVPSDFNGAIIKYGVDGKIISSKHFKAGIINKNIIDKIEEKTSTLSNKKVRETNNSNNYANAGCYIVDHWWVTWNLDTGEIISIEWEGSTEYCTGGGGGSGGGNNGPNNQEVADAAAQSILNSMLPVSEVVSEVEQSNDGVTRERIYSWRCVKNPTYSVIAYDRGVHRKKPQGWVWQTLENVGISTQGYVVGGTVTATKVFANPIMGIQNSKMDITVNIASTVTVKGVPATKYQDFSSQITWNVNSPANPGY